MLAMGDSDNGFGSGQRCQSLFKLDHTMLAMGDSDNGFGSGQRCQSLAGPLKRPRRRRNKADSLMGTRRFH